MSDTTVIYRPEGRIGYLILNRPEKLNAISPALIADFNTALDQADADDEVRVLIMKGAGRAFSVGMDLTAGYKPNEMTITEDRDRLVMNMDWFLRVWDFRKPIVAEVHGYCCAAATMLALAADITLVSTDCKIRFPSIPLGGGFVSTFWTFFVGPKRAKEMDYIANSEISGSEAEAWGWANHAVAPTELEGFARDLAGKIARTPPDLLGLKKGAINRVMELQGFRQAAMGGVEWDTLCHFSAGAREMRQRIADRGLKGAQESLDE